MEDATLASNLLLSLLPLLILGLVFAAFAAGLIFLAVRVLGYQRRTAEALERIEKRLGER
jgi:hypothetical protein